MLKNKKLLKIFAVLAVLVMSICMLTGCGNSEENKKDEKEENKEVAAYEEPVKNFVEGMAEADSEKFIKAFPDFLAEYVEDVFTDEMLESALEGAEESYGTNIKMSFKVTNKEEISEDELAQQQEDIKTNYGKDVTVSKGYILDVDITTKGDDSEETESDTINVYEVDGKWCIIEF